MHRMRVWKEGCRVVLAWSLPFVAFGVVAGQRPPLAIADCYTECVQSGTQCVQYGTQCAQYGTQCAQYGTQCGSYTTQCAQYSTQCAEYQTVTTDVLDGYERQCHSTDFDGTGTGGEICVDVPIYRPTQETICVRQEDVCTQEEQVCVQEAEVCLQEETICEETAY